MMKWPIKATGRNCVYEHDYTVSQHKCCFYFYLDGIWSCFIFLYFFIYLSDGFIQSAMNNVGH